MAQLRTFNTKYSVSAGWEFPGGKIEAGETPQQAVDREILEELDATIRGGDLIDTIEYDYPAFHLSMDCFWCEVASGELKLLEAEAAKWLAKEELDSVQWLPADVTLIDKIRKSMENDSAIYRRLAGKNWICNVCCFHIYRKCCVDKCRNC